MTTTTTLSVDTGVSTDFGIPFLGNDSLMGSAEADIVLGGQGSDTLDGMNGADTVNGNSGADIVHGGNGDDTIFGGRDADTVYGDLGDDRVSGDRGNDFLYGGVGADRFVFGVGYGQDWIGDFSYEQGDKIMLAPGTQYKILTLAGQVLIDLGNGDIIGLIGQGNFNDDYITYG